MGVCLCYETAVWSCKTPLTDTHTRAHTHTHSEREKLLGMAVISFITIFFLTE